MNGAPSVVIVLANGNGKNKGSDATDGHPLVKVARECVWSLTYLFTLTYILFDCLPLKY